MSAKSAKRGQEEIQFTPRDVLDEILDEPILSRAKKYLPTGKGGH